MELDADTVVALLTGAGAVVAGGVRWWRGRVKNKGSELISKRINVYDALKELGAAYTRIVRVRNGGKIMSPDRPAYAEVLYATGPATDLGEATVFLGEQRARLYGAVHGLEPNADVATLGTGEVQAWAESRGYKFVTLYCFADHDKYLVIIEVYATKKLRLDFGPLEKALTA